MGMGDTIQLAPNQTTRVRVEQKAERLNSCRSVERHTEYVPHKRIALGLSHGSDS